MARSKYPSLGKKRRSATPFRVFLLLVLFIVGAVVGLGALRHASSPVIEFELGAGVIGPRGHVKVTFREPDRGLAEVQLELVQGELVRILCAKAFRPRAPHELWGDVTREHTCEAEIGKEAFPEIEEGALELRATAGRAGSWISAPEPLVERRPVKVKLTPPLVSVTSTHIYVAQGGAEVVVYTVGDDAVKHGVEIKGWSFPGYALPGGAPGQAFALFAIPFNVAGTEELRLFAEDTLGNRASRTGFVHEFFPKPPTTDTIRLSDAFMKKVAEEMIPRVKSVQDKGDLLQNYLQLNGPLRERNRARLRELAQSSAQRFLWSEPFLPMKNAAVMGSFADQRTYTYNGAAVDTQTHLGIDFASVAQAPIQAANNGVVLHADYLGIYGNSVIIDHGYGLMTLYGHLSTISVGTGEEVARGQEIGRSGNTGMAGGDHLHYATLLQGYPINPKEWWDANWLNDRLKLKLGEALPLAAEGN